jgi:hypothetical protein
MKKFLLIPVLLSACLNLYSQDFLTGFTFQDYSDIIPDTLLNYTVAPYTNETYGIKLFGDETNTLEFTARGAVSSGGSAAFINVTILNPKVYVRLERLDSVYVPATTSWNITKVAEPLGTGVVINTLDAIWDSTTLFLTDHSGSGGGNKDVNDWKGGEKYLGLKFKDENSVAYGWIRVECPNVDSCYLKDYSFTQKIIGINEINLPQTMIYPNPVIHSFCIKNINVNTFDLSNLKLKDIYAREIQFSCEMKANEINIVPDPNLADGCYILEYLSKDCTFSKKLVKID